jgi:hypothetical protein
LFHAATVPRLPPSEFSPREKHLPFSEPLLPCSYPPTCKYAQPRTLLLMVQPDAHQSALPSYPTSYGFPFTSRSPGCPGSSPVEPHLTVGFTYFAALLLSRIRSRQPGLHPTVSRYSPGLLPLQSFLLPRLDTSDLTRKTWLIAETLRPLRQARPHRTSQLDLLGRASPFGLPRAAPQRRLFSHSLEVVAHHYS